MITRLASLPQEWRERRRWARLRRAMRRGTLLEVIEDVDVDERGGRRGERTELRGCEPPVGRAVQIGRLRQ